MSIVMGPVLQYCGLDTAQQRYIVSVLIVTEFNAQAPTLTSTYLKTPLTQFGSAPATSPKYGMWRATLALPKSDTPSSYSVDGKSYDVYAPSDEVPVRMAYGSCNGFSDPKLMKEVAVKNDRWSNILKEHESTPYHVLLLGGDQVYSDGMWEQLKQLKDWTALPLDRRTKTAWTKDMEAACDRYFADLYIRQWKQPEVAKVLAQIPSIMMWDDHDIMDGWGSYPAELHNSPVYQGIFSVAKRYFHQLQLQLAEGEKHFSQLGNTGGYNLGFEAINNVAILALDLRSERQPEPDQIVSPDSWTEIYAWLDKLTAKQSNATPKVKHLIVMSSIPVAYLDLNEIEKALGALPGQQELEDDLRDHWRSRAHQQERLRLVHRLLDFSNASGIRVSLVSGDVHVGALAIIESTRKTVDDRSNIINQLISSALVHPCPPSLVRWALEQFCSAPEQVDQGITSTISGIGLKNSKLIGSRNWLALELDDTERIWSKWHIEGENQPASKVIHPCS